MQGANILLEPGVFPRLLQGLWVTIWIAAVSVGLSIPLGLLCGWLMTLRNPVIRFVMRVYLDFIRIMPQLALLFIAFYGIARMSNWNMDATASCVFVFVLWGGAELGDLVYVRGLLLSESVRVEITEIFEIFIRIFRHLRPVGGNPAASSARRGLRGIFAGRFGMVRFAARGGAQRHREHQTDGRQKSRLFSHILPP